MAATKKVKEEEINEVQELNLDTQVTLRSIAAWDTGFARKVDGIGDVIIPPKGSTRLKRSEVIAQVQMGNKLIGGANLDGNHATLIIEDAPTRIELNFESADGSVKQKVFSDELMKELFALKTDKSFQNRVRADIVTRAEKCAAIEAVTRLKLNDFNKIRFLEEYTGFKVQ